MPFPFEKLEIYKRSLSFAGKIEALCSSLKRKVTYSIFDQLTRAAVSIPLNIAEGNGRQFLPSGHNSHAIPDTLLEADKNTYTYQHV